MNFFNQYSFLLLAGSAGVGLLGLLWRWQRGNPWVRAGIMAWYVFAVVGVAWLGRYPATPEITTAAQVETYLNNGSPSLLLLYSNY